jgi:hypothetical protein
MYSFALALCSNLAFEAPSLVTSFQVGMQIGGIHSQAGA